MSVPIFFHCDHLGYHTRNDAGCQVFFLDSFKIFLIRFKSRRKGAFSAFFAENTPLIKTFVYLLQLRNPRHSHINRLDFVPRRIIHNAGNRQAEQPLECFDGVLRLFIEIAIFIDRRNR